MADAHPLRLLTINTGSSSLKAARYVTDGPEGAVRRSFSATAERIGASGAGEAALADPGLTADEHELPLCVGGLCEQPRAGRQLVVAPNNDRAGSGCQPRHWQPPRLDQARKRKNIQGGNERKKRTIKRMGFRRLALECQSRRAR